MMPAASVNAVSACGADRVSLHCVPTPIASRVHARATVVPNGSVGSAATASSNRCRRPSAPGRATARPAARGTRRIRRCHTDAELDPPATRLGVAPLGVRAALSSTRGCAATRSAPRVSTTADSSRTELVEGRPVHVGQQRRGLVAPVEPQQERDARVRFVAASDRVGGRQLDVDPDRERIGIGSASDHHAPTRRMGRPDPSNRSKAPPPAASSTVARSRSGSTPTTASASRSPPSRSSSSRSSRCALASAAGSCKVSASRSTTLPTTPQQASRRSVAARGGTRRHSQCRSPGRLRPP